MTILVSGSLVYDKIMDFPGRFRERIMPDKIHVLSVCFTVNKMRVNFGGTAGNIAYNLKLLGAEPLVLSQAGANDFGAYGEWLRKNKIDGRGIRLIKGMNTASAFIITDRDDNQITALHLETMGTASGITEKKIGRIGRIGDIGRIGRINDIGQTGRTERTGWAIVAPGNTADMMSAARVYRKLQIPYVADPGQQIPALTAGELKYLISGAKALVCNDYEAGSITKTLKHKSIKALKRTVGVLVVTYGAKGSVIYSGDRLIKIKAVKPRKAVDPTGAGDAYRAGLIYGLAKGWRLEQCGKLASWTAKHPVEHYGTQEHKFRLVDFKG